jgi:excisionase family DNA binding protein
VKQAKQSRRPTGQQDDGSKCRRREATSVASIPRQRQEVQPPATFVPRLLYPVPEAAGLLGISSAKLREKLAKGEVPSVRLDGRRLVAYAALVAYVNRLQAEQGQEVST